MFKNEITENSVIIYLSGRIDSGNASGLEKELLAQMLMRLKRIYLEPWIRQRENP